MVMRLIESLFLSDLFLEVCLRCSESFNSATAPQGADLCFECSELKAGFAPLNKRNSSKGPGLDLSATDSKASSGKESSSATAEPSKVKKRYTPNPPSRQEVDPAALTEKVRSSGLMQCIHAVRATMLKEPPKDTVSDLKVLEQRLAEIEEDCITVIAEIADGKHK